MSHCTPPTSPPRSRWPAIGLALLLIVVALLLLRFRHPAQPGFDQNAYLLTARSLAQQHTLFQPRADPYAFLGRMFTITPNLQAVAKYPWGFPLLLAIMRTLAGPQAVYWANPLLFLLACLAGYAFFRTLLEPAAALCGTLLLATNPVALSFACDLNSHTADLLVSLLGMTLLIRWHQRGHRVLAVLAGLCLGYATTIRYPNALLALPLIFLLVLAVRHPDRRRSAAFLLLAYLLPILALLCVNRAIFGSAFHTGYADTAEAAAFSFRYLLHPSAFMPESPGTLLTYAWQINTLGLLLLWPLGLLGSVALLRNHRAAGVTLGLWAIPLTTLYLLYYWAPPGWNAAYLRFFLTTFPAIILAAVYLLRRHLWLLSAMCILLAVVNLTSVYPSLQAKADAYGHLRQTTAELQSVLPSDAVVFTEEDLANHLSSATDFRLYLARQFMPQAFDLFQKMARTLGPNPVPRSRLSAYLQLLGTPNAAGQLVARTAEDLRASERQLILQHLAAGHAVAFVIEASDASWLIPASPDYHTVELRRWVLTEPRIPPGIGLGRLASQDSMLRRQLWSNHATTLVAVAVVSNGSP